MHETKKQGPQCHQGIVHKAYRGFAPGHLYRFVPHRLFLDVQVAPVSKPRESSHKDIIVTTCKHDIVDMFLLSLRPKAFARHAQIKQRPLPRRLGRIRMSLSSECEGASTRGEVDSRGLCFVQGEEALESIVHFDYLVRTRTDAHL